MMRTYSCRYAAIRALLKLDAHRIERAEREHGRSQEPRHSEIIRARRKRKIVEGGASLRHADDLLSDPPPEMRRKRHALAAIAHAVMDPLVPPQMWQGIECICHPPHPRVS